MDIAQPSGNGYRAFKAISYRLPHCRGKEVNVHDINITDTPSSCTYHTHRLSTTQQKHDVSPTTGGAIKWGRSKGEDWNHSTTDKYIAPVDNKVNVH